MWYGGVLSHRGTPKSSHFGRIFHYQPSILVYPISGNPYDKKYCYYGVNTQWWLRQMLDWEVQIRWKIVCLHGHEGWAYWKNIIGRMRIGILSHKCTPGWTPGTLDNEIHSKHTTEICGLFRFTSLNAVSNCQALVSSSHDIRVDTANNPWPAWHERREASQGCKGGWAGNHHHHHHHHTSCIIYYVSYIMSHISCIMYHVSYIMYHISCIMYHVSYININTVQTSFQDIVTPRYPNGYDKRL